MKKILFFFILFFTFNTLEIESNSDKYLVYDRKDILGLKESPTDKGKENFLKFYKDAKWLS